MQLQETYGEQGFHILAFEAQGSSADSIRSIMKERKSNFAVASGYPQGFQGTGSIPQGWLIDVNGKVVWEGNHANDLEDMVKDELKKVKYPGLGKTEVSKDCEKAAKYFVEGKFAKAREEATEVIEDEDASDEAKADAEHITDRVSKRASLLMNKAEEAANDRRYQKALDIYDDIAKAFKKCEEGDEAEEKAKEMRADKEIKAEIKAYEKYEKLLAGIERLNAKAQKDALEKFVEKNEGTKAAEDAEERALEIDVD